MLHTASPSGDMWRIVEGE